MKDIAYYAGFLASEQQTAITAANKQQLLYLLTDLTHDLYFSMEGEQFNALDIDWRRKSDRDKIALIRGLCDRIEVKLIQEAGTKPEKDDYITIITRVEK